MGFSCKQIILNSWHSNWWKIFTWMVNIQGRQIKQFWYAIFHMFEWLRLITQVGIHVLNDMEKREHSIGGRIANLYGHCGNHMTALQKFTIFLSWTYNQSICVVSQGRALLNCIYNGFIHNNKTQETTSMCLNWRVNKENVIHLDSGHYTTVKNYIMWFLGKWVELEKTFLMKYTRPRKTNMVSTHKRIWPGK